MTGRYGVQDFKNNRLQNVATPIASGDGVNKAFIRYDWPTGCVGQPLSAGEKFPYLVVPVAFSIPVNLVGSQARCLTAPAANATWTLYRIPSGSSTATAIATCTFSAGSTTGSFTATNAITFAILDMLYWTAPSPLDSAQADIGILVAGIR